MRRCPLLALLTLVVGSGSFLAESSRVELCGDLVKDKTLVEGVEYLLTCPYVVKSNVTLTLEPGVTILAKDTKEQLPAVIITRGSKVLPSIHRQNSRPQSSAKYPRLALH